MKYKVRAIYHASVELEIEGEEGADMTDPSNWGDIVSEHQCDYYLHDVTRAEVIEVR